MDRKIDSRIKKNCPQFNDSKIVTQRSWMGRSTRWRGIELRFKDRKIDSRIAIITKDRFNDSKIVVGKKSTPRRGIEPRSPAWQAGILTTILSWSDYNHILSILSIRSARNINQNLFAAGVLAVLNFEISYFRLETSGFHPRPLLPKWRGRRHPEEPWFAVTIVIINPFSSVSCGKYLENVIYDQIGRYVVYFKTPLKDLKNKLFMHKLQDAFKMI